MRQELARAVRIEQSRWRVVPSLDRKLRHDSFDHRIANKKLRNDLDPSGIGAPILEDDTRQERVLYEHHDAVRRTIRFPSRVEIRRTEIHGPRIGPTLNQSSSLLAPYTMPTGRVQPQRSFSKGTGRFEWCRIDHMYAEAVRCCRLHSRSRKQIRKLGRRNGLSLQRRNLKSQRGSCRAIHATTIATFPTNITQEISGVSVDGCAQDIGVSTTRTSWFIRTRRRSSR